MSKIEKSKKLSEKIVKKSRYMCSDCFLMVFSVFVTLCSNFSLFFSPCVGNIYKFYFKFSLS